MSLKEVDNMAYKNQFNPTIIADWIREQRLKKGMTQVVFANAFGVSERQLRRYEADGVSDIYTIIELANYFGVDCTSLFTKSIIGKGMHDSMPFHMLINRLIYVRHNCLL